MQFFKEYLQPIFTKHNTQFHNLFSLVWKPYLLIYNWYFISEIYFLPNIKTQKKMYPTFFFFLQRLDVFFCLKQSNRILSSSFFFFFFTKGHLTLVAVKMARLIMVFGDPSLSPFHILFFLCLSCFFFHFSVMPLISDCLLIDPCLFNTGCCHMPADVFIWQINQHKLETNQELLPLMLQNKSPK